MRYGAFFARAQAQAYSGPSGCYFPGICRRARGRFAMSKQRQGFTLIELLVVIAIIAVLISLLVPAVQKVREAAGNTKCKNNLKQLGLACMSYHDAQGLFPPGGGRVGGGGGLSQTTDNGSWLVYLLPYVEQDNLLKQIDSAPGPAGRRILNAYTAGVLPAVVPFFRCPSDDYNSK